MPIYRPGYVMAAIYEDDDSILHPVEKLIYRFLSKLTAYKRGCRERWLAGQRFILQMAKKGVRNFLVPGAGIPTAGHVHQLVPEARVLYLDKEESIVKLANEVIKDKPNVRYVQGDLREWSEIEKLCDEFFGPSPRVGIVFIGASYFFRDEDLRQLFGAWYNWAGSGSMLAIDILNSEAPITPAQRLFGFIYALTGNAYVFRDDAQIRSLLSPWKVDSIEPILYNLPHGFTGKFKVAAELTEDERNIPPVDVGYLAYKP